MADLGKITLGVLEIRKVVLDITKKLGLVISFEKSCFTLTQSLVYLEMNFDTVAFTVTPAEKRIANLFGCSMGILHHVCVSKEVAVPLGVTWLSSGSLFYLPESCPDCSNAGSSSGDSDKSNKRRL